jgi:hypothetical protein
MVATVPHCCRAIDFGIDGEGFLISGVGASGFARDSPTTRKSLSSSVNI